MNNRKLGKHGEEIAVKYLRQNGYQIVEQNYSCKLGEIDIIAHKNKVLCFIEVKTRSSIVYGMPCEAVNYKKKCHIILAAKHYVQAHAYQVRNLDIRFDIIEILVEQEGKNYCRHLEGAFVC